MELYEIIPVRVRAKQYTQAMQDSFIALGKKPNENPIEVKLDFIPDAKLLFNWHTLDCEMCTNEFTYLIEVGDYIIINNWGYSALPEKEFLEKYKKVLDLEKIGKKVDEALDNITPQDIIEYFPSVVKNEINSETEYNKEDAKSKSLIALREHLANMTPEQRAEMQEHFRDKRPKGWLSIEEHLPMMYAKDVGQWYSEFKVKFDDGKEGVSRVGDGNMWYYHAKEEGITHWFNE